MAEKSGWRAKSGKALSLLLPYPSIDFGFSIAENVRLDLVVIPVTTGIQSSFPLLDPTLASVASSAGMTIVQSIESLFASMIRHS